MPVRFQNRKAIHKWLRKERVILLILKRKYPPKDVKRIFDSIFTSKLQAEGFVDGIRSTALSAQHTEMKHGGNGHDIFLEIDSASDEELASRYPQYLRDIESAVASIPTSSTARIPRSLAITGPHTNGSRQHVRHAAQENSTTIDSAVLSVRGQPVDPRSQLHAFMYQESPYFEHEECQIEPMISPSLSQTSTPSRKHPKLLFRSAPIHLMYRSRALHTGRFIPPVPEFGSDAFIGIALPHMQKCRKYESPFVSLAQNPRTSIRRLHTACSEGAEEKMFLAVFTYEDLERYKIEEDGSIPDYGPFLARSLELPYLPDGYRGQGEVCKRGYRLMPDVLTVPVAFFQIYIVRPCGSFRCAPSH